MKYILGKRFLAITPEYDISESYYNDLKESKRILVEALRIEEAYEVLLSLYKDLEKLILSISMDHLLSRGMSYERMFEGMLTVNVKLVGFLSGARLYIDQLKSRCGKIKKESDYKARVEALFSEKYEASIEYRFMEALRNYTAHRGLPVHSILFDGAWDSDDMSKAHNMHQVVVYSTKDSFSKDKRYFKSKVLNEMDDKVNIIYYVRCYVEAISSVHDSSRKIISDHVNQSRALVEEAKSMYVNNCDTSDFGLCAYKKIDGELIDEVPLLLDWDDLRVKMQKDNSELVSLSRRYVSNKNLKKV